MSTPFLTYELLTPETADPVKIKIVGLRERDFENFKASNGITIGSWRDELGWYIAKAHKLLLAGTSQIEDADTIPIVARDWPAVKQAIRELNEYYKEKDMKKDRYEFPIDEWDRVYRTTTPIKLILTRKKPRVKTIEERINDLEDKVAELEQKANEVKG